MRQQTKRQAVCIAASFVMAMCAERVAAQGSLTPPGAPAPTMKTLEQVEPRTPIGNGRYTITKSGSYYLTENSTGKITIRANNVTLDLMGFRIAVSGDAIEIPKGYGQYSVIRNGTLCPGNNSFAVYAEYADNCLIEKLRIEGNNAWCGIYIDDNSLVRDCDVSGCNNCGIIVGEGTEVSGCRVIGGTLDGIQAGSNCRITGNVIEDHGDDGLYITGSKTYIADNIIKGNGDNYDIAAGNQLNILLCEVPETLEWPCSVKFAGTLTYQDTYPDTNGITVKAHNVTINMDGHSLIGPGASDVGLCGIYQQVNYVNLRVYNGKITQWKGEYKYALYAHEQNNQIENIQVSDNYSGIYAGTSCKISGCTAYRNDRYGIYMLEGCTCSGCTVYDNDYYGIYGEYGCTISGCTASCNGTRGGIGGNSGCTISGCTVRYNKGDGIRINDDCLVTKNCCDNNGNNGDGAGIHATGSKNRIDSNNVVNNDRGIDVDAASNLIVRNSASGNGTDYDIVNGNDKGTIQTTPVGAEAWDNFSF